MLQPTHIAERWCQRSGKCVQVSWSEIPLTESIENAADVFRHPLHCTGGQPEACPVISESTEPGQWHLCSVWNKLLHEQEHH
jgi:hypothetical protein